MNVNVTEKAETPVVPDEVQRYLDIDLSPSGEAARNLNERAGYDASREKIPLSDIQGTQLSNATPGMQEWYQLYIAPSRGLALSAISKLFKERSDRAHGDGFLLASRQAALEDGQLASKRNCYKQHADRNYVDSEKVTQLETKIREDTYRYNVKKAELGREAKVLNRPLYLFVLFVAIFGSEAALNLEAFEALP